MADLSQTLEGLTNQQGELLRSMESLAERVEKGDTEAKAQVKAIADELAVVTEDRKKKEAEADAAELRSEIASLREQMERTPSKAGLIGGSVSSQNDVDLPGFFWSVWASKSVQSPELHAIGKANLDRLGSSYMGVPSESKATLGDSAAAGGNIIPLNVVGEIVKVQTAANPYRSLLNVVNAGFVTGVDVPAESGTLARASIAAAGATKSNINLTTSKYTATMYTLAVIYDIGNQLLRNSRGAVEQLVRSRLARAFALGEAYYILQGSGTSEPKGILTSIGTSGIYVTSFTASSTTLAGSSAAAIAKATGVLANRARRPDGVVVNASDFWIMAAQGTDSAGFFFAPSQGPGGVDPTNGQLRVWGLPVYADPNMPTDSMVVGEWGSADLYTGQNYRVDVSDVAGTRWDTNVTGFRGEEEIGFNADPYVVSGLFQRVTDFTP